MKFCLACQRCYEEAFTSCADDQSALAASRPRARTVAGKYRIDRLISRGPNAVYEGTQLKTGRPVAIKLILPDWDADAGAVRRFRQEALAVAHVNTRIDHQHVVRTRDYGLLPDGIAYIVMELVEGRALRERLDAEGLLGADDATRIARQVAEGLAAAHDYGVRHGDLRPSNILLARDHHGRPEAKVINFGFAGPRVAPPPRGDGESAAAGVPEGEPGYLSPEQLSGQAADARSDVYSLGAVLSEMLGRRAPRTSPAGSSADAVRPGELSRRGADDEGVPEPLRTLLRRALDEKPAARLQSAAEFARRLRSIECPPEPLSPNVPAEDDSASDESTTAAAAAEIDEPTPPGTEAAAAAAAPPGAGRPARKIGLVDDYSSDFFVEGATSRDASRPRVDDAASAHAARETQGRPLLAFAIPTLLVLILGAAASSWLTSRSGAPAPQPLASSGAAAEASSAAPNLPEPPEPDAVAAERPEADAAGPSPGGESFLPAAGTPADAAASEDGSLAPAKTRDGGSSAATAARPQAGPRVAAAAGVSAAGGGRAADRGCIISTSKSALTLRGGGSDEIAVKLDRPAGGAPAVTATTSDWSDIVVLAAPAAARGGGSGTAYRVVSVSKRGGTYAVTFSSPCGSKRVPVTVE